MWYALDVKKLQHLWWVLLLRGIALIVFGFVAFTWSIQTFVTLAFIFALYILFSGVLNSIHAVMGIGSHSHWFVRLVIGVFEIGVGIFALSNPILNISALAFLIGITFIIRGVLELFIAFERLYSISMRILLCFGGIFGIFAGIIILTSPQIGIPVLVWVMGIYAFLAGILAVFLSIFLRNLPAKFAKKGLIL